MFDDAVEVKIRNVARKLPDCYVIDPNKTTVCCTIDGSCDQRALVCCPSVRNEDVGGPNMKLDPRQLGKAQVAITAQRPNNISLHL